MKRPNENPLTSACLATDEIQGEDAKADSLGGTKHIPHAADVRLLALSGLSSVRALLARYAAMTDQPAPGMADAADLLDAAYNAMEGVL